MTDCVFCRIVAGEIPSNTVYEDESVVAFRDLNPGAPTHVLVVPRQHLTSAEDLAADPELSAAVLLAASRVARQEALDGGHRLVFNTGPDAGQTVFHVHLHVLGGRRLAWPPG